MSRTYDINHAEADLLRFIDNQSESIMQAFRMASERNENDAEAWAGMDATVARMLRESAESWSDKADRLEALLSALPEDWEPGA